MDAKVEAGNLFSSATTHLVDVADDQVPDLVADPDLEDDELVVESEQVVEPPLYPIPEGPPLSPPADTSTTGPTKS